MKKTININLGGTFFHIDEDAFAKLSRYLEAIRKSLSDPQGGDEIIRDIETRIAELFNEKIESNSQVVSLKELDEVIKVMGQPEDYAIHEDTFDDASGGSFKSYNTQANNAKYKQLFRDVDNKFVAGVCSGLGHYLRVDALWIRLFWILITFASGGFGILAYILLWILVPGAETINDKLKMTGEPINISNIEKKFYEGYQSVADSIKNADYDKYGAKIKKSSSTFFESVGSVIITLLKVFVKFFGLILLVTGLIGFVSLVIGLVAFGTFGIYNGGEGLEIIHLADVTNTPIWILTSLGILAAGIPMIILFILGLKIIAPNVKSLGNSAKIILGLLWLGALIAIGVIGIKQATSRAYEDNTVNEISLPVNKNVPFTLAMQSNKQFEYEATRSGNMQIKKDENGDRVLYSNDVRLIVRSTTDSVASLVIEKSARGRDYIEAKEISEAINYGYNYSNNALMLDGYFTTSIDNKYRDQEIQVILYLPENTQLVANRNTRSFHRNDSRYRDILDVGDEGKLLLIMSDGVKCLDCANNNDSEYETLNTDGTLENDTPKEDWEKEVYNSLNNNAATKKVESVDDEYSF